MKTIDTEGIITYETEVGGSGLITLGKFTVAAPTTANKFSKFCMLLGNDGKVYTNSGTSAAPVFIAPSHITVYAGKYTTVGGSATEVQTLTGVASTDIVIATLNTKGATPRTILTAAPTTNTITYVFSGDPSTDHIVAYQVLRATA